MYDKAIESALERVQHDALLKFKERLRHAPMVEQDSHASNESCNCTEECDKLHVSRLPHDVRVSAGNLAEKFKRTRHDFNHISHFFQYEC